MRIVVSGASGLLGSSLVPALREAGHEVVRLVRRDAQAADEMAWGPAAGALDPAALAGADAVVNLSGANIGRRWTKERKREIRESRVVTTSLLARALSQLDSPASVFVCAGGVGVYGDRGDEILTEESEAGEGFLASVLVEKEAATEPAREAGIRVVNLRQGIILSAEGGALARMLPFFKLGVGGRVGSGRQWWSWVSMKDMVAAYRFVLEGDLAGPVNVASPDLVRSAQFVKSLGRVLRRPTVFPVPALGIKTLWGEMGEAALLEGQRALPKRLLAAGFTFGDPELEAALRRTLEASPRTAS